MAEEQDRSSDGPMGTQDSRTDSIVDPERSSGGPLSQFFADLLTVQCRCSRARRGAVLGSDGAEGFRLLALYPQAPQDQEFGDWLEQSAATARNALSAGAPAVVQMPGGDGTHAVFVPLETRTSGRVLEAFLIKTADKTALQAARQLLELTVALVSMTQQHLTQQGRETGLKRLQKAMETLSAVNRHNRFKGVAMAFCNELASQWGCERASVGFLKGRYVQVKAISHTEHYSRKMRLVQDIEAAMEESLDQDCEILYPPSDEVACISRAAGELSARDGQGVLLSLPLRDNGRPQAVLTLERATEKPFTAEEVETIRLTCDLCAPRLMNLHDYDRWTGARAVARVRRGLAILVGAEHTWAKMAVVVVFGLVLFSIFAKGWYRVKAPFVLEAVSQYQIAAPFDGFIKAVDVEVGDLVVENVTALAELDTAELRLQLAAAKAERAGYLKQADAAMRDGETAEAQIAEANAQKVQARIDLFAYRVEQGKILSPVSGTLVTGDLKRQIGAPVETGKVLFEVAPLDSLRAELYVPEAEVCDIEVGRQGHVATASYPAQRIRFVVERVNPAAEVVNNRNVFRVRARLLETRPWMRPGMEGVAKVTIEKRRYVWIWTRKVINWLRMKLWL